MEPKQQRLNFSDYSARQQEIDATRAERRQTKDIYIMKVNGDWGAVMPRKRHNIVINADKGVKIEEFIKNVKEDLTEFGIKPRFHCVQNFGIKCKIAEYQNDDFTKLRAMKEFNKGDNNGY